MTSLEPPAPDAPAPHASATPEEARPRLLTARWVFPIVGPPIRDGAIRIEGQRIVAVGRRRDVPGAGAAREELGDAAILPGLVNCHAHLELGAVGRVAASSFVGWLLEVRARRAALPPPAHAAAAAAGARALLAGGVTCVGDVSTAGRSLAGLAAAGLRGVVYREVLGVEPERAAAALEAARADLAAMAGSGGPLLRAGLSPHSPYACSEALLRGAARLAARVRVPLCMHVAESREEREYLAAGTGDIPARLYPAVGAAPPPRRPAGSPLAYLDALDAIPAQSLLVHAVHLEAGDLPRLQGRRAGVAHCPRSNALLSGGVAPVPALLAARVPVGLGTDSLAGVASLDLWDEMRAALAAQAGGLEARAVLRMATLGGAACLGLDRWVGSLEPGKQADLVAVSAAAVTPQAPEASLLAGTTAADVRLVLVAGAPRIARLEGAPVCR
ncbi:MAG: amidohydrolase family protein [Candidatus Methylomirabilales bacterium]